MRLVKFTSGITQRTLYINPDHVMSAWPTPDGETEIIMTGGEHYYVKDNLDTAVLKLICGIAKPEEHTT